jgi:hypothetical protein
MARQWRSKPQTSNTTTGSSWLTLFSLNLFLLFLILTSLVSGVFHSPFHRSPSRVIQPIHTTNRAVAPSPRMIRRPAAAPKQNPSEQAHQRRPLGTIAGALAAANQSLSRVLLLPLPRPLIFRCRACIEIPLNSPARSKQCHWILSASNLAKQLAADARLNLQLLTQHQLARAPEAPSSCGVQNGHFSPDRLVCLTSAPLESGVFRRSNNLTALIVIYNICLDQFICSFLCCISF